MKIKYLFFFCSSQTTSQQNHRHLWRNTATLRFCADAIFCFDHLRRSACQRPIIKMSITFRLSFGCATKFCRGEPESKAQFTLAWLCCIFLKICVTYLIPGPLVLVWPSNKLHHHGTWMTDVFLIFNSKIVLFVFGLFQTSLLSFSKTLLVLFYFTQIFQNIHTRKLKQKHQLILECREIFYT